MTRQSHTFRNPRKRTTRNPLDLRTFAAMTRQSHTFRNPRKRTPRFAAMPRQSHTFRNPRFADVRGHATIFVEVRGITIFAGLEGGLPIARVEYVYKTIPPSPTTTKSIFKTFPNSKKIYKFTVTRFCKCQF